MNEIYLSVVRKMWEPFLQVYRNNENYQTQVIVEVFEGEDKLTKNNRLLGKFALPGLPPRPRGQVRQCFFKQNGSRRAVHNFLYSRNIIRLYYDSLPHDNYGQYNKRR